MELGTYMNFVLRYAPLQRVQLRGQSLADLPSCGQGKHAGRPYTFGAFSKKKGPLQELYPRHATQAKRTRTRTLFKPYF